MGNIFSSEFLALKDGGRRVIVQGAGEDEANGLYVETTEMHDGKPQFKYSGRSRNNAPISIWWINSGKQWSIRKDARGFASTGKLWYIASDRSGADVSGELPPTEGWGVSARAGDRAFGVAAFSIDPAPSIRLLGADEAVPKRVVHDMEQRAAKYIADKE
ncbi:unnamed protein product [Polarella glacialis]|uniref:Uncharacterized protein n=1 Tax=Polarella glacialis TaxID=89957 RepID=A0A813GXT5_POLGL|nr:unnamed protein product [Polarella glacialis]CAE8662271.1 unnamed protein product [Polarella glacialis]